MAVSIKKPDGGLADLAEPYIKNADNVWVPLSEIWQRVGDNVYKVWPDQIKSPSSPASP